MLQIHTDFDQAENERLQQAAEEIERLKQEKQIYENVIHAIANITQYLLIQMARKENGTIKKR